MLAGHWWAKDFANQAGTPEKKFTQWLQEQNPHIFFVPLPTTTINKKTYPKTNNLSRLIIGQPSVHYSHKPF